MENDYYRKLRVAKGHVRRWEKRIKLLQAEQVLHCADWGYTGTSTQLVFVPVRRPDTPLLPNNTWRLTDISLTVCPATHGCIFCELARLDARHLGEHLVLAEIEVDRVVRLKPATPSKSKRLPNPSGE